VPNGDDMGPVTDGDQDEGGGMYGGPQVPVVEDDDNGNRMNKRRTRRRHGRPQFRSTRKARQTGGRR
jgi:hypothetical protein